LVFAGVTQDPSGFFTFKQELVDVDPIAQAIQTGETTRQLESLSNFFLPQLNVPTVSADLFARVRDNLSQTFSEFRDIFQLQATQLVGLGQASIDISGALSEQVAIREEQKARIEEQLRNQQIAINAISEGQAGSVTGFDPIAFFTENPLIGGIGIGGLAVGAIVLLLLLRR